MRVTLPLIMVTVVLSLAACDDDPKTTNNWNNVNNTNNLNNLNNVNNTNNLNNLNNTNNTNNEPGPLPELAGTWAHLQLNGSLMNMPMVGLQSNKLISLVLVTMTQDGTALTASEVVCDIKIESSTSLVTTIIPQAFINSMPVVLKPVELVWDGAAWDYVQPQHWALQGVTLENLETDPLPTDKNDPRVFDQDLDSHPGLTVSVTGLLSGDIYVIQRGWNSMLSNELTQDHLFGYLTWANEQVVLDATNNNLKTPIESTVDPDPTKSWFEFVRVDPGSTCQYLIDNKTTLFPRLAN